MSRPSRPSRSATPKHEEGRRRRPFVSILVHAAPAGVALAVAHEAAANPPPTTILPDPPVSAPTKDEPPTVVRKHEGLCYAFYPSGGTLAVECPKELAAEPLGESILKNASGRCQFIPLHSGGEGSTSFLPSCPKVFSVVAKAGQIPKASSELVAAAMSARPPPEPIEDEPPSWVPPPPARVDVTAPQQVGCGGCATSAPSAGDALGAALVALAVAGTRRRRRARASLGERDPHR